MQCIKHKNLNYDVTVYPMQQLYSTRYSKHYFYWCYPWSWSVTYVVINNQLAITNSLSADDMTKMLSQRIGSLPIPNKSNTQDLNAY